MVSKKLIKSYDFETIENYFDYILESEINGQRSQVESLVKALSSSQNRECLNYLSQYSGPDVEIVKNLLFHSL